MKQPTQPVDSWLGLLRCLLAGVAGGALLSLIGMPLAWLVGPILGNFLLLTRGVSVWLPDPLRTLGLGVMGLMMGSLVTRDLINQWSHWYLSISVLIVSVIVSTLLVARWYRHCGFDRPSAWLSAMPGGMAAMVMVVDQAGGNLQRVAVSQALRVLIVVCTLPPLLMMFGSHESGSREALSSAPSGFHGVWMLLFIPLLVPLGKRLGIAASPMLMPLLFSAALSVFELESFAIPAWGMNLALVFLGCSIGAKFGAFSLRAIINNARITLVATLLAIGVFALFAEGIYQLTGISREVALLALAPGGMAEMSALAVALGLDPLFVAFHQLFRVVALVLLAPFLARHLQAKGRHLP